MVGCNTPQQSAIAYPAPSFEAPVAAPAPARGYYYVARPVVAAAPRVAAVVPHKTAPVVTMAGIPASWVPPVTARPWRWIIVHHSATTTGGAAAFDKMHRFNEYGIGICLVGNFDIERPTPEQLKSLDKLIAYLMVTYHITPENILRHKDTKVTDCPGTYLNIELVKRQSAAIAGASIKPSNISASTEMLQDVPAGN
jgi:hypothetical protein